MSDRQFVAIAYEFERWVAQLLKWHSLTIVESAATSRELRADLRVRNRDDLEALVEIKFYRSLDGGRAVMRTGLAVLKAAMTAHAVERGLFVTNSNTHMGFRLEAKELGIDVLDYASLSALSAGNPSLAEVFADLQQRGLAYRSGPLPDPEPAELPVFLDWLPEPAPVEQPHERAGAGAELCNALRKIPAKPSQATAFEAACTAALRHLFNDDLIGWSPQQATKGRLHRFDLIARIASQHDFWNAMITDHRARYIIFEFKNYKAAITQAEIYSTEKYLFPLAMRGAAIIISPKGASPNAYRVTEGALRETGKVILNLTVDQVCEMLHRKDKGDDPTAVIADTLDDMLVGLER